MFNRSAVRFGAAALALAAFVAVGAAWQPAPTAPAQPPAGGGDKAPAAGQPPQPGQPGPRGERGPGGPGGRGGAGGQVNVGNSMKGINRAMEQLHKQIDDATKKDENLKLINDMERGCVMAKGAPLPGDVLGRAKDAAEKAKWSADYRTHLLATLRLMIDVEQDILDGKGESAGKKLDQINKIREDSHKVMGIKEED